MTGRATSSTQARPRFVNPFAWALAVAAFSSLALSSPALAQGRASDASADRKERSVNDAPTQLARLAREARTPGEHAKVAKSYREQAEAFDAQAATHEARVAELSKSPSPMAHKWPAMASPDMTKERQRAVEARRAARESRAAADRHLRMSVEALAND